ncbi:MAG: TIGR03087 family PEP-CTERM/XrtA system glycosyltransferase, partial [Rhizomicrobium sp.]
MRDLLFLAHRIPYPPDKGDKIRSYHILRHLASRFRIHLGCFFDDRADECHIAPLREICSEIFCIPLSRARKVLLGLRGAAFGKSISEAVYQDKRLRVWIRNTLRIHDINDIFVFCSSMSPYVRDIDDSCRVVIDLVDVDSEKWGAYARSARWPLSGLYRFEQRRVRALEKRAVAACDRTLFVSRAEAETFLKLAPELCGHAEYLENGVDLNRFDPACVFRNPFESGVSAVVFTGAMDYRPNIDAVVWFAREIFPSVRRARAGVEFWIVGANPPASVRRLSRQPGIKVTDSVADVRPYL